MRRLEVYVSKYGDEAGPRLYHLLQSQAAHAGVSARLRKKIDRLTSQPAPPTSEQAALPLFPEAVGPAEEASVAMEVGA